MKLFNSIKISHMYTPQGQGEINLPEKNFDFNLKFLLLQSYTRDVRNELLIVL